VRTVLLGAAGRNDNGGLPSRDRIADFLPGELLDEDGVRRVTAVVVANDCSAGVTACGAGIV